MDDGVKPPLWRRIVADFVCAYADAQRARNLSATWTAVATVAIAIFSAATIGVGIAQWNIQSRTLDVMHSEQRAFVSGTPYWDGSEKSGWRFGDAWGNVGNTPTAEMADYVNYKSGSEPIDFSKADKAAPIATGFLAPKQTVLGPSVPSTGSFDKVTIASGKYVYGWVKYRDVFPGSNSHVTKFCFLVRATGDDKTPFVFPLCHKHNCADDGCKKD